jgi:hypothetical protein
MERGERQDILSLRREALVPFSDKIYRGYLDYEKLYAVQINCTRNSSGCD